MLLFERINNARKEYLYDGLNTSLNNKVFKRSWNNSKFNFTTHYGSSIAQTLQSVGDKKGGRDYSQYIYMKRAAYGNEYVGNKIIT